MKKKLADYLCKSDAINHGMPYMIVVKMGVKLVVLITLVHKVLDKTIQKVILWGKASIHHLANNRFLLHKLIVKFVVT